MVSLAIPDGWCIFPFVRFVLFHLIALSLLLGSPAGLFGQGACGCAAEGGHEMAGVSCCGGPQQCCVQREEDRSEEAPFVAVLPAAGLLLDAAPAQERFVLAAAPEPASSPVPVCFLHPPPLSVGARLSLGQAWLI
jgi:hypothetical protein